MADVIEKPALDLRVSPPAEWPGWRKAELVANTANPRVGTVLVSETPRARVWHLTLAPGERLPFHRHVLDYFWTVTRTGPRPLALRLGRGAGGGVRESATPPISASPPASR